FLISGCATSQSEVALTLQRLRLVDGVSEAVLQNSTKSASGGSGEARGPAHHPAVSGQVTFAAPPARPPPGAVQDQRQATTAVARESDGGGRGGRRGLDGRGLAGAQAGGQAAGPGQRGQLPARGGRKRSCERASGASTLRRGVRLGRGPRQSRAPRRRSAVAD